MTSTEIEQKIIDTKKIIDEKEQELNSIKEDLYFLNQHLITSLEEDLNSALRVNESLMAQVN